MSKNILDACCGGRMMWCDKGDQRILAQDIRAEKVCFTDRENRRTMFITPDVIGDFRKMRFADNNFSLVMFDPPHLLRAGESSWLFKKYGKLDAEAWEADLTAGFRECMRVLRPLGTLIFKWNSCQLSIDKVKRCFPCEPVFVSRTGKTYFYIFMKGEPKNGVVQN